MNSIYLYKNPNLVKKTAWLELRDSKKDLKRSSRVYITVEFFTLTQSDVKFGINQSSDIPMVYTFDMKKKEAVNKNSHTILITKHFMSLSNYMWKFGYNLKDDTRLYIKNIDTVVKK